jgi:hypothetical protein
MKQIMWCSLFRVHRDISSGHNCENYDCWLIGHHRYILVNVLLKDMASFFFCYYPVTVSGQWRSIISAHRNANGLLEDLVSKDYIGIVYKKGKHTLSCDIVALRENFIDRPESYDSFRAKSCVFLVHDLGVYFSIPLHNLAQSKV